MKKFVIFILTCICVLISNAQIKNAEGKKVIKKIEVYPYDETKPTSTVEFNYTNSLDLKEIVLTNPSKDKLIWRMDGDILRHVEYDSEGNLKSERDYHYKLINGLITECIIDNIGLDGRVLRYSRYYHYDNENRLVTVDRHVFFHENKKEFSELSDRYRELFSWDDNGNVYTTGDVGWTWKNGEEFDPSVMYKKRVYNTELGNDTNIDFSMLLDNFSNQERFENVTEWMGKHSSNLLETNIFNYFDYVYDKESDETDSTKDKGNIIQIIVYASNKKLRSTYKITYLE